MKPEILWAILITANAIVNIPFVVYLFKHRKPDMAVLSQFQATVDQLNELVPQIAALKANSTSPQDVADTLTAVQSAVTAIQTAVEGPQ